LLKPAIFPLSGAPNLGLLARPAFLPLLAAIGDDDETKKRDNNNSPHESQKPSDIRLDRVNITDYILMDLIFQLVI
jgi:hypothetical protein